MDTDISDMMHKFSDMMGNSTSPTASENNNSNCEKNSFDISSISPEMISQFASAFQKNR